MLRYAITKRAGWVRLKNLILIYTSYPPLFSERNGYRKFYSIPFTNYRVRVGWESFK